MNDHALERLAERLEELEERVSVLEHLPAPRQPEASPHAEIMLEPPVADTSPATQSGNIFPVLGRAMLGIAGAYVLRAVAETSSLPKPAVASVGIFYAFLWLLWAARARRCMQFARTLYAGTSVLILAPMLWELTIRFKVLPPAVTAGVLCAFAIVALAPAVFARTRSNGESVGHTESVLRVACIASAGLALTLAIASHQALPFIVVLLTLSAICEFSPGIEHMPEIRVVVALAADMMIWIQIYTYFGQQNALGDYPILSNRILLAPGILLFLIFAGGVSFKTALLRKQITAFETIQTTIAFLLAAVSLADFLPLSSSATLGPICLLLSAAGYASVFTIFDQAPQRRNAAVFAAWSTALLLCGCLLCLPSQWIAAGLDIAAIAATWVGRQPGRLAFTFYGFVFLVVASISAALPAFLVSTFIGNPTGTPPPSVWIVAISASLCYGATKSLAGESWIPHTLRIAIAALAAAAIAALLAHGLFTLIALIVSPGTHHLAFLRTLTLCLASLVFAFGGSHWHRTELTRLGFVTLAIVAFKLVFEDLRQGHLEYIAGSIFLFAITLIAVPRVVRARQKTLG